MPKQMNDPRVTTEYLKATRLVKPVEAYQWGRTVNVLIFDDLGRGIMYPDRLEKIQDEFSKKGIRAEQIVRFESVGDTGLLFYVTDDEVNDESNE